MTLELEVDATALAALPAHATRVALSADQARKLAGELEARADRVEQADVNDRETGPAGVGSTPDS